ncbi:MAG: hypothetical protein SFT94_01335 [Pseudanabaenaceae cyanobacterium bins.68]|nr:hypothetical protein [Pseudanabaenaceae cyanobacterium bins.68]
MITKSEVGKLYEKGIDELYLFINELEKKYKQEQPKPQPTVVSASKQPELNVSVPSIRKIHGLIRDRARVEIKLRVNESLQGRICWIDPECIGIADGETESVIWLKAIASVQQI